MEIHRTIPINPKKVQKELHKSAKKQLKHSINPITAEFLSGRWLSPDSLKNHGVSSSVGMMIPFPTVSGKKHVPNHQPVYMGINMD